MDRAVEAFKDEDFARAHRLFERAYALKPNARVLRGLGIAALRLARYSEAKRALSSALTESQQALTASQREEVIGLLSWMETNLGTIQLQWVPTEPREYELSVDGQSTPGTPLVLSPGEHRLNVRAPGYAPLERSLEIAAADDQTLTLALMREKPRTEPKVAPAKPAATVVKPAPATPTRAENHAMVPARPLHDSAAEPSVFERWWFWTAVGVIAAGGVTTAILLTTSTKEYEQSSFGQVTLTLERAR